MIVYKRNIRKKVLSLQFLFFIIVAITTWSYDKNYFNLFYFLIAVFIFFNFIVIENYIVEDGAILLKKYYFFGCISSKWTFDKHDNFTIFPENSSFGQDGENEINDGETLVGCLLSVVGIFLPGKVVEQEFTLKKYLENGKVRSIIRILLDQYKYNLLREFKENIDKHSINTTLSP